VLCDLVANQADKIGDRNAVTFEGGGERPDEMRTYRQLWENGNRAAAGLIAKGLQRGDRFGLLMRNHPEFIETMIGASITGTVSVPIDPRTRGEKLAYTLRNSNCKGVVLADYALKNLVAIRKQLPDLQWIMALDTGEEPGSLQSSAVPGASSLAEWFGAPLRMVDVQLQSINDPLQIIYTSGTTGDPKGVVFGNLRFGGAGMLAYAFQLRPDDRLYTGLSLTHGNAQLLTLAPAMRLGIDVVFSRKFTKSRLWDICRKYGCTVFNLLGGMATAVYSEPRRNDDADNPVRMVISAGMPKPIWEAFEKRFNLRVLEMYGAIEGGFAFKPIGDGPIGSFGKVPAGTDLKIVDEDGNECPPNVPGEMISRPATARVQVEYFGNQEASANKTKGGWLWSGDICHKDENGWLFFDYRKGGGIRHNGDFVNPGFVEKAIAEHPQVADVFVYGVPAASGSPGEKDVVAAIVPVDRAVFDAAAVFAQCRRELEPNFVPSYLQVVSEIPKTASEKPQERFLIERFAPDAEDVFTQ
jgi:crotonobetaine/carnitine-CoA ligase